MVLLTHYCNLSWSDPTINSFSVIIILVLLYETFLSSVASALLTYMPYPYLPSVASHDISRFGKSLLVFLWRILFNSSLYGGGGMCPPSRQFFRYSSKTFGARLLKLCDFYCYCTHHLVYFLVTRDLSCCHGNPIFNTFLAKKWPKSKSKFSRL